MTHAPGEDKSKTAAHQKNGAAQPSKGAHKAAVQARLERNQEERNRQTLAGFEWPEGRCKQIAYISPDHHLHELVVGAGGAWQHADLTTLTGAPEATSRFLVGYAWPEEGTKQVTYLGPEGHLYELSVTIGGSWQFTNLTSMAGAPPAIEVTAGYSWSAGRCKQVVFVDEDSHLHELSRGWEKPWKHINLTALTHAPLPASKRMVGYGWEAGQCKQVAYVGQDGHLHELYVEVGARKRWRHVDLSALTDAPEARDLLVGYEWPQGGSKQIAFVGEDDHLHELSLEAGQGWRHVDLSTLTGAPLAGDVLTGYAWPEGQMKQLAYVDQVGRLHELSLEVGRTWQHVDLTALAQAPLTPITAIEGYAWSTGHTKQVAYVGNDGTIREVWIPQGGQWTYADLNELVLSLPGRV
ncbi:MAG TPA: hypothetical protein VKR06_41810 [Ktedonosporobacter sp.]|nr:hypothetical protein [Ktedonosporobacter sp.]